MQLVAPGATTALAEPPRFSFDGFRIVRSSPPPPLAGDGALKQRSQGRQELGRDAGRRGHLSGP